MYKIMSGFEHIKGTKLKLKSASRLETKRSEIPNSGSMQPVNTLFNEPFSLVACNQCYTALCQFADGIRP